MTASRLTVARILSVYRGGSTAPALVETADGERWVLKFAGAGPGQRGLLVELVASRIAAACGLPVPTVRPLWLASGFPWQAGTDEFDDVVQRSAGWNLGVAHLPEAETFAESVTALPRSFAARLAGVDALLANYDRSAHNPNLLRDRTGKLWAIDHDACLFVARALAGGRAATALPPNHLLHGQATVPPSVPDEAVGASLADAPDAWLTAWDATRGELAAALTAYLSPAR